jgi:EAL domain-containing protein (putative c-di-GMP-specific phosphodiesterase class I)
MAIAQRILQQAREPIALDGGELQATLTVGIALGAPGADPAELVRDADLAMYRAKSMLRGSIEMFDPTLRLVAQSRARLERELREALDGDQFRLQYQPIVSLADGGISGFEALVRWQHPTRGLLNAASFVPLAEESGLLVPLGRWVLREACRDVKRWRVRHNRDLMVSVNMSPRELLQPELISYLKKTLSEQDVPASALRIEITESVFLEHADSVVTALAKLDGLGVKLMLDDFGTGYSSLSYLHRFPITTVKIDRYFVSRMAGESECWEIVRSILTLARNLGMEVIAEGAETPEQNDMLSALRCPFVQGFFYSRPVPSEGVDSFLRKPIHHFGLTPPDGLPAIRV